MTWFIILHEFLFFGVGVDFFLGEISLGRRGDVGIAPYEIPPALRATSLFKGGLRANNVRPYGEIVLVWERDGAMWASPPTIPPAAPDGAATSY